MITKIGIVQSHILDKNIIVKVSYNIQNKKYKSMFKVIKKYKVSDIRNEARQGDIVLITFYNSIKQNKKNLIKILKKYNP